MYASKTSVCTMCNIFSDLPILLQRLVKHRHNFSFVVFFAAVFTFSFFPLLVLLSTGNERDLKKQTQIVTPDSLKWLLMILKHVFALRMCMMMICIGIHSTWSFGISTDR